MNKKLRLLILLLTAFSINSFSQDNTNDVAGSIEKFFQKAESFGYSGNVLIAQKGKIILKKGYGWQDREKKVKESAETFFDIGSITKQFTAAAILKLESEGKLSVSDNLLKFFPDAPEDKKNISIHQLLTHSAGFPGAIGDDYDLITADEFMKLAFKTKLLFAPGSQYEYSNVGYSILGIIIEKLSGKDYETYLHDQLFVPAGMMHTGYLLPKFKNEQLAVAYRDDERWGTMLEHPWAADGPGWHLKANGGILSTLDDMHKWYLALRNKTILPATEVSRLFVPYIKETGGETFYGYGWVIEPLEKGDTLIWHNGGNGAFNTYMGFDLKNDLVIIVSSNSNDKIADDYAMQIRELLSGNNSEAAKADVQSYTGNYKMESGDTIGVTTDEFDRVTVSFHSTLALIAISGDGTEDKNSSAEYNRRTKQMIENALKGNFTDLAAAWNEPVDALQKRVGDFWDSMKKSSGDLQNVNVLGSVARNKRGLYHTFVQVNFAKGSKYFVYTWKEKKLDGMQPDNKGFSKLFFPQPDGTFLSPNNQKTIVFEKNTLQIKSTDKVVKATKFFDIFFCTVIWLKLNEYMF
jgi:CubicO group peptidase (beta-lactamase class C family)